MSLTSVISTKLLKMMSEIIVQDRQINSTNSATSLAFQAETELPDTATTENSKLVKIQMVKMAFSATAGTQQKRNSTA